MKQWIAAFVAGVLFLSTASSEDFIARLSGSFVELRSPEGSVLGSFCVPDAEDVRTNGKQIVALCRGGWIKVYNRSGSQQACFIVPNAVGIQVMSDSISVKRSDTRNIFIYDMQGSLRRSI